MIVQAKYVVPVDQPPIEDGAVHIREGRIVAVGSASAMPARPGNDFGDAVIFPGLVNAHTHLELSLLRGAVPPSKSLPDWLSRLVGRMRNDPPTPESVAQAVRLGVRQSLMSGVTMIGDITGHPSWSRPILAQQPIRCVSYGEVIAIGKRRGNLAERLTAATCADHQTDRLRIGVSPHAPYTVEPNGLAECARRASTNSLPLCIHLAESSDEDEYTQFRTGPLADHLRHLGVWDDEIPCSGLRAVELTADTGLLGSTTVLAHANYVTDSQIELIARSGSNVAYCPRTHHAFGHPPHRFRDMLAAGVNVCIGTDSLASNPSLSIIDELRFLKRELPTCSVDMLVELATLAGARAMNADHQVGSISAGKLADLAVFPLATGDNWESILNVDTPPLEVFLEGTPMIDSAKTD